MYVSSGKSPFLPSDPSYLFLLCPSILSTRELKDHPFFFVCTSYALDNSRLLSVLPVDTQKLITTGTGGSLDNSESITPSSPSRDDESVSAVKMKRRKSTKGWDGEDPAARFTDTLEGTGTVYPFLSLPPLFFFPFLHPTSFFAFLFFISPMKNLKPDP